MTGISALFPDSPFFNSYYMGGVERNIVQPVPVLTGAFLFVRTDVIREVGMLDEEYFMYGEDIDLCYRMLKAGYQNYYLPEPTIIHYKGESTHREEFRYVKHFYNAMLIYVRKHYEGVGGQIFQLMIILGVLTRGALGALRRFARRALPVVIDAVLIVLILVVVKVFWAQLYFADVDHFDRRFTIFNIPVYAGLWLLFLFLSGAHDVQRNARRIINGMVFGTIAILLVYAMLPLEFRSSRAVIVLSAVWATVLLILSTGLWRLIKKVGMARRIAVVGNFNEVKRIMEILNRSASRSVVVGWIAVDDDPGNADMMGHVSQLQTLTHDHRVEELVFSQDLPFSEINYWMSRIGPSVSYRISSTGSDQIVGSDSRKEQGKLYQAHVEFGLSYPMHRRLKRILDIFVTVICLIVSPFARLLGGAKGVSLRAYGEILRGRKTWVGYHPNDQQSDRLPVIPEGIIHPGTLDILREPSEIQMINYIYAREYTVWKDVDIILRNLSKLV
jgi:hypothetical protein